MMAIHQRLAPVNGKGTPPITSAPPHNTEIEKALLGSLLIDPEAWDEIDVFHLCPEDFYRNRHRTIFEMMQNLRKRRVIVDFLTLSDELERSARMEDLDYESDYVMKLVDGVPTSGSAHYYAGIIKSYSTCWRVLRGISDVAGPAYAGEAAEAVEALEKLVYEINTHTVNKIDLVAVNALSQSFLERLGELSQNPQWVTGVPTGLHDLDRLTAGFQRSDLIVLAARPAMGKTSLSMTFAANAALKYGKRVVFFSLEMSKEQLYQRLVSMIAGVDQKLLKVGAIDDEEWERVIAAIGELEQAEIYIDDTPAITAQEIERKVRRLIAQGLAPDLVIIDYLGLMRSAHGKAENRVQEVSTIVRDVKEVIARGLNLPVLLLSQINRAVESRQSKVPQLSDLRESGEVEQTADIVAFIYRDDVYNPDSERQNLADIIVAKHRNGEVGEVTTYFRKKHTKFENIEHALSSPSEMSTQEEEEDYE